MNLQNSLANLSFLSLLISMILYWVETSFTDIILVDIPESNQKNFLKRVTEPTQWGGKKGLGKNFAYFSVLISNILLGLLLLLRWKDSGHFPLSNLYESLIFLSWCLTSLHLYVDNFTSDFISGNSQLIKKENTNFGRKLIGAITTPSALLTNTFATFTLPKEMQEVTPLVPALQSNWLMMHVTVMILSYAALILGSLLSIAFLIVTSDFKKGSPFQITAKDSQEIDENLSLSSISLSNNSLSKSSNLTNDLQSNYPDNLSSFLNESQNPQLLDLQKQRPPGLETFKEKNLESISSTLDNLSYRILGIGFPLLTIGILSGAVWANEAWGSYWSWDPKETWAFLTWLIFAIYLHTRLSKGWEGKKPAMIASFGFVIVWVCYLGVNLLGEGLHSYGWIVKS